MRIAVVSSAYPFRGGISRFTDAMTAELTRRNHVVDVFTFSRQYPDLLFPGKSQYDTSDTSPAVRAIESIDSLNPLSWFNTAKRIVAINPDVVVFNYWMPFFAPAFGTIAKTISKKTSAKIVFVCHNVTPHERRIGDAALTRYVLSKADEFIVLSKTVGQDVTAVLPNASITQTPHPVYDTYGPPIPRMDARRRLSVDTENVLLFFGLIRKYKGLDTLLDAMPIVLDQLDCKLIVAGEFYDEEEYYRTKLRDNNIAENVQIKSGFVPDENVVEYFCASDVVVLPYKSATQSGIVQIATHFDRACIVTDTGGLSEMIQDGETGYVVPVEDPNALARAIIRFFRDNQSDKFEATIAGAKDDYSWSTFASVLERVATA